MKIIISHTLLAEAKKGDRKAMQELYALTVRCLTSLCQRYIAQDEDVKDVLQDSYIKIFRGLKDFTPTGEGALVSWMVQIVTNESLMFLRSQKRLQYIEATDILPDVEDELPVERFSPNEVHRAIRLLPTGYRTVLNLYVFEEKSHKEIAQLLGIKENTSASQLNRAKALLKKILQEQEGGTE